MFYINVINWNSATYQNVIRICDREGCFLEISAICWSNGQSHSWGQKRLSIFLQNELQRHCINYPNDPDKKRKNIHNSYMSLVNSLRPVQTRKGWHLRTCDLDTHLTTNAVKKWIKFENWSATCWRIRRGPQERHPAGCWRFGRRCFPVKGWHWGLTKGSPAETPADSPGWSSDWTRFWPDRAARWLGCRLWVFEADAILVSE